jgi:hypothetical protein
MELDRLLIRNLDKVANENETVINNENNGNVSSANVY